MRLAGKNIGDELTVITEEVSRSGNIQSKATKYVTELKVVLQHNTRYGGDLFTFHMAGVIQVT